MKSRPKAWTYQYKQHMILVRVSEMNAGAWATCVRVRVPQAELGEGIHRVGETERLRFRSSDAARMAGEGLGKAYIDDLH